MTDYTLEDTIYLQFTTRAFATGVPTVLAGTPALSVLEQNNATPITAGVSVSVDRASVVGLNEATIVATAANGYAAGTYCVYVSTGTVGGVSVVGEVVGSFTLNASAAFTRLGAPAGASVSADIAVIEGQTDDIGVAGAGLTNINLPNQTMDITGDITGNVSGSVGSVTNERGKYQNGAVWIGPTVNTNTVSYVDGIITNPVSTIAAAKTIADALEMRNFHTVRTGASQIGADMTGYNFEGDGWSCTTTGGSRDVSGSTFHDASVIGGTYASTSGRHFWIGCDFATGVSVAESKAVDCTYNGTLTLTAAGDYDFIDCSSVVAGTAAPVFAVPAGVVNISFRRWSGGVHITGITTDTTISVDAVSGGTVTLEGADGNVQVRGMVTVTDSRTGSPTLGTNQVVNQTTISDAVLDEALSGHTTAGSLGKAVTDIESDVTLILADTADMQPKLGTPAADVSADIAAVKVDTAAVLVDTGTTLPALLPTALVGGRMDSNMSAISGSATAADNLEASALGIVPGECEGTPTTTVIQTDLAEATDGHYIGRVIIFTSGNAAGEASDITDYTGATGTVTVTAITTAPASTDTFVIV